MSQSHWLPIYFPLGILIVDDDPDLLDGLSLALKFRFPRNDVRVAQSGREGLSILQQKPFHLKTILQGSDEELDYASSEMGCRVRLDSLQQFELHANYSNATGIIIIDYAMPGMNGLDFARLARDYGGSKILLTGQATQNEAITAFNAGLIDRYVRKEDPRAIEVLSDYVAELEIALLQPLNSAVNELLRPYAAPFLGEAAVNMALATLCKQAGTTWTTVSITPPGIRVIDGEGNQRTWIVMGEEMRKSHAEVAEAEGAEPHVLQAIRSGSHLPFFAANEGRGGYFRRGLDPARGLHPVLDSPAAGYYIAEIGP